MKKKILNEKRGKYDRKKRGCGWFVLGSTAMASHAIIIRPWELVFDVQV